MGVGWVKVAKGCSALVRMQTVDDDATTIRRIVTIVHESCSASGGKCAASVAMKRLPPELIAYMQASLQMKSLKSLSSNVAAAAEMTARGVRLNGRGNGFLLDGIEDNDVWHVSFNRSHLAAARVAIDHALKKLPTPAPRRGSGGRPSSFGHGGGGGFLTSPPAPCSASDLQREQSSEGYVRMQRVRARLPAYAMGDAICAAVREARVTLVLGATGCGKTTQLPQLLYEDNAARGVPCRIVASQPRRISAVSVAERVAVERGGSLGDTVGFKIRFEDQVSPSSRLVFCTVGILLKTLQSNPTLAGATHVVVDEVHERDLHTDFFLLLLKRLLSARSELKVVLMSATVDPSAFQQYFPEATTVVIPGKTNYPIEELFLEDILPLLGGEVCSALATAHALPAETVDLDLLVRVVAHIHKTALSTDGGDGAILCFVPGWFEIAEALKLLGASEVGSALQVFPLHSRMPTAEQRAIFLPPPPGRRKVVVATILAETSITIEDVVFVVDSGRTRTTFVNEATLVSALRTCFYSKASGLQRRGRAGRCRSGAWYRLYSSLQWNAMVDYSPPEMLRSPLEELCLEVASLGLGPPAEFLSQTISPPKPEAVQHAVTLLHRLGAVEDAGGATLTPLGEKLAKLQVHPMLGKLLLLGGLFRCVQPLLTVAASLGYKSPFLCPLGKEAEANAAKRDLAGGSDSDHVALIAALDGWQRERHRFASRHFLSSQTLEYIERLRSDLSDGARELLHRLPADLLDRKYLADVVSATLVAALYPNLAWLRRFGKGETCSGLKVVAHPGSVNARAAEALVVYYDIQETSDRYLYDTSRVQMAPCLLFAADLAVARRTPTRTTLRLGGWAISVDTPAADELLILRAKVSEFVQRACGQPPTPEHAAAIEALCRIFSEHAPVVAGIGDEDDGEDGEEDADVADGDPWAAFRGEAEAGKNGGAPGVSSTGTAAPAPRQNSAGLGDLELPDCWEDSD